MKRQEYTYSKVHLWKDKNKSDSEMWHLFPSHSCSPGDLAAKEKEKKRRVCDENFITQNFRWRNDELMELQ